MLPIRFGPSVDSSFGPPLAGVLHEAEASPGRTAVLLCPPFGQEAIRTHRLYRVLAERLSRLGMSCLRFDYHGTGDSLGDELEGHLLRWCRDIIEADEEIRRRTGCTQTVWVGARLGASLMIQASMQAPRAPSALVCWAPVIDGPAYLQELAHAHVAALSGPFRPAVPPAGLRPPGEALGFGMSDALMDQIATLCTPDLPAWQGRMVLIGPSTDGAFARWAHALQQKHTRCDMRTLDVSFEWHAEEAMNTALVPQAALQCLLASIQAVAA